MSLEEDISRILGRGKTSADPEVLALHAGDKWYAFVLPELVVFPESTEDVSLLMRYASSMNIPVTARGGGVGYVGGCVPVRGGISLSLERMNRILEIAPEDGVAVVEPGVITADLQRKVRALGWFYPPDPASRKECSIGGNIATNAGGPRCLKYGVTKAYVLGLTVVLASGEVVECGGRTHKNKTGFDLGDLFIGSEGMLGIITRAVLRIIPHPETFGALSVSFPQFPLAAAAVQRILAGGHLPSALEITDSFTLQAARAYLGESSLPSGSRGHLIVEVDGRRAAVKEELDSLCALLEKCNATDILRADTEEEAEAVLAAPQGVFLQPESHRHDQAQRGYRHPQVPPGGAGGVLRVHAPGNGAGHRLFRPFRGRQHPYQYHGGRLRGPGKKGPGGRLRGQAVPLGSGLRRFHHRRTRHRPGESQMVPGSRGGRRLPPARARKIRPGPGKFAQSGKNGTSVA